MENEKALKKNPEMKYCSGLCQKLKLDKKDGDLEAFILKRLGDLRTTNICPSQLTREYFGEDWKSNHQRVISASRRLKLRKKIEILQKKKTVSSLNFKGPIRIQISR